MVFESVVEKILSWVCGKFILGVDNKKLSFGIFAGQVEVSNMYLNPECLDSLGLPFSLKASRIGSAKFSIPWKALSTSPVDCIVQDLFLVLGLKRENEWRVPEKFSAEFKERELLSYISKILEMGKGLKGEKSAKGSGVFTKGIIQRVVDNLQLTLKNIQVRIESFSGERQYAFGLSIDSISLLTTNEKGEARFLDRSKAASLGLPMVKTLQVSSLQLKWDQEHLLKEEENSKEKKNGEMDLMALKRLKENEKNERKVISGELTGRLVQYNLSEQLILLSTPITMVDVSSSRISVETDREFFLSLGSFLNFISRHSVFVSREMNKLKYSPFKPYFRISSLNSFSLDEETRKKIIRSWWKFAIQSVCQSLLQKNAEENLFEIPSNILEKLKGKFLALHLRAMPGSKEGLNPVEKEELRHVLRAVPLKMLKEWADVNVWDAIESPGLEEDGYGSQKNLLLEFKEDEERQSGFSGILTQEEREEFLSFLDKNFIEPGAQGKALKFPATYEKMKISLNLEKMAIVFNGIQTKDKDLLQVKNEQEFMIGVTGLTVNWMLNGNGRQSRSNASLRDLEIKLVEKGEEKRKELEVLKRSASLEGLFLSARVVLNPIEQPETQLQVHLEVGSLDLVWTPKLIPVLRELCQIQRECPQYGCQKLFSNFNLKETESLQPTVFLNKLKKSLVRMSIAELNLLFSNNTELIDQTESTNSGQKMVICIKRTLFVSQKGREPEDFKTKPKKSLIFEPFYFYLGSCSLNFFSSLKDASPYKMVEEFNILLSLKINTSQLNQPKRLQTLKGNEYQVPGSFLKFSLLVEPVLIKGEGPVVLETLQFIQRAVFFDQNSISFKGSQENSKNKWVKGFFAEPKSTLEKIEKPDVATELLTKPIFVPKNGFALDFSDYSRVLSVKLKLTQVSFSVIKNIGISYPVIRFNLHGTTLNFSWENSRVLVGCGKFSLFSNYMNIDTGIKEPFIEQSDFLVDLTAQASNFSVVLTQPNSSLGVGVNLSPAFLKLIVLLLRDWKLLKMKPQTTCPEQKDESQKESEIGSISFTLKNETGYDIELELHTNQRGERSSVFSQSYFETPKNSRRPNELIIYQEKGYLNLDTPTPKPQIFGDFLESVIKVPADCKINLPSRGIFDLPDYLYYLTLLKKELKASIPDLVTPRNPIVSPTKSIENHEKYLYSKSEVPPRSPKSSESREKFLQSMSEGKATQKELKSQEIRFHASRRLRVGRVTPARIYLEGIRSNMLLCSTKIDWTNSRREITLGTDVLLENRTTCTIKVLMKKISVSDPFVLLLNAKESKGVPYDWTMSTIEVTIKGLRAPPSTLPFALKTLRAQPSGWEYQLRVSTEHFLILKVHHDANCFSKTTIQFLPVIVLRNSLPFTIFYEFHSNLAQPFQGELCPQEEAEELRLDYTRPSFIKIRTQGHTWSNKYGILANKNVVLPRQIGITDVRGLSGSITVDHSQFSNQGYYRIVFYADTVIVNQTGKKLLFFSKIDEKSDMQSLSGQESFEKQNKTVLGVYLAHSTPKTLLQIAEKSFPEARSNPFAIGSLNSGAFVIPKEGSSLFESAYSFNSVLTLVDDQAQLFTKTIQLGPRVIVLNESRGTLFVSEPDDSIAEVHKISPGQKLPLFEWSQSEARKIHLKYSLIENGEACEYTMAMMASISAETPGISCVCLAKKGSLKERVHLKSDVKCIKGICYVFISDLGEATYMMRVNNLMGEGVWMRVRQEFSLEELTKTDQLILEHGDLGVPYAWRDPGGTPKVLLAAIYRGKNEILTQLKLNFDQVNQYHCFCAKKGEVFLKVKSFLIGDSNILQFERISEEEYELNQDTEQIKKTITDGSQKRVSLNLTRLVFSVFSIDRNRLIELVCFHFEGLELGLELSQNKSKYHLLLKSLQCDTNGIQNPHYPFLISQNNLRNSGLLANQESFFNLHAVQDRCSESKTLIFDEINISMGQVSISFDEKLLSLFVNLSRILQRIANFEDKLMIIANWFGNNSKILLEGTQLEWERPLTNPSSVYLYARSLVLQPLNIILSFETQKTVGESPNTGSVLGSIGFCLGSFMDFGLKIPGIKAENSHDSAQNFRAIMIEYYRSAILNQIIGKSESLDTKVGLLYNLCAKYSEFVDYSNQPRDPKGSNESSLQNLLGTNHSNAMALSPEFRAESERIKMSKAEKIDEAVSIAFEGCEGLKDVFTKPLPKKDVQITSGFFSEIILGAKGAVTKGASSLLDMASKMTETFVPGTSVKELSEENVRPPRPFYTTLQYISHFSQEDAASFKNVKRLKKGKYSHLYFYFAEDIDQTRKGPVSLIGTSEFLFSMTGDQANWKIYHENISKIISKGTSLEIQLHSKTTKISSSKISIPAENPTKCAHLYEILQAYKAKSTV